jgi:uncharacterized Rmd1/YagE family protein
MPDITPIAKPEFTARAILVGERLDLRSFESAARLALGPLAVSVSGGGIAVLFKFGAVVFFDVAGSAQAEFLRQLQHAISQPHKSPETEQLTIRIEADGREGIEASVLTLCDASIHKLQLVADVIGKSLVLAMYESSLAQTFDRIEPFAANLEESRNPGKAVRELLQHLGGALLTEHRMVGRAELGDRPELLWDHPPLERLYGRLIEEFEIRDRDDALNRKLELVARTSQIAIDMLNHRRSLRVEWYIVLLIVFEIVLSLLEKAWPWIAP